MGLDLFLSIGLSIGAWAIPLIWAGGTFGSLPFPFMPAWAVFALWAGYFAFGGGAPKFATIGKIAPCYLLGAVVGTITIYLWQNLGPADNLSFALWDFVFVALIGLCAHIGIFATIPATILAFANTIGVYLLSLGSAPTLSVWQSLANMILVIILGLALGWLSEATAVLLASKPGTVPGEGGGDTLQS